VAEKLSSVKLIILYEKFLKHGLPTTFKENVLQFKDEAALYKYLINKCKPVYLLYQQIIEAKTQNKGLPGLTKITPYYEKESHIEYAIDLMYNEKYLTYSDLSHEEKKIYNSPNMEAILHDPCQPYDLNLNLINAYNRHMELLPGNEDWAIFIDHDALWTTYHWKRQIAQYIESYPEYSCFTCLTNRVASVKQVAPNAPTNNNYEEHRAFGELLANAPLELEDFTIPTPNHLSGVVIVLHKSAWKNIGKFKTWNATSNILGVDSALHRDLHQHGYKLGIMKNVYVYHWYRGGNSQDKSHLKH
jgi:hypothetical protein